MVSIVCGSVDQPQNFHLLAPERADQRVFTMDPMDQVGPAPPPGFAVAVRLLRLLLGAWRGLRGLQRGSAVTRPIRVGAIDGVGSPVRPAAGRIAGHAR
jgi:hypothetical protein